jgi:hypothetical protein
MVLSGSRFLSNEFGNGMSIVVLTTYLPNHSDS